MPTAEQRDRFAAALQERIDHEGFAVVVPDIQTLTYGYTIGLPQLLNLPEFVITGLEHQQIESILRQAIAHFRLHKFEPGTPTTGIIRDFEAAWVEVHPSNVAMLMPALEAFHETPPTVYQLVWPDMSGAYPWSRFCDPLIRARQPGLGEPQDWQKRGLPRRPLN
jgi:hypothetical protein